MNQTGKLFGVGVGPGDPELMTLKAVRLIRECDIVFVPGKVPEETVAYQIAVQAVSEICEKKLVGINMPMTKDQELLRKSHEEAVATAAGYLEAGCNCVFLTLGDPCIYSTYIYVHKQLSKQGYQTEIVSGIPSFLAVSAKLNEGLVEGAQMLHVIPATYQVEEGMDLPGTKVFMKSGKALGKVKAAMQKANLDGKMIERCGMPGEQIYNSVEQFPDEAGYYSLVIAKEKEGM